MKIFTFSSLDRITRKINFTFLIIIILIIIIIYQFNLEKNEQVSSLRKSYNKVDRLIENEEETKALYELPNYLQNSQSKYPLRQACPLIFDSNKINFSSNYYKHLDDFTKFSIDMIQEHGDMEGHSNQVNSEKLALHTLSSLQFVKTICETGFNVGHSSFNFLTSNPHSRVFSFDLGVHGYTRPMADYLMKVFPGRISVCYGDSSKTVADFVEKSRITPIQCDLIFVDGGHTYQLAKADITNLAQLGTPGKTLIFFDDHPTSWSSGFAMFWDESVRNGNIKEIVSCKHGLVDGLERGFSFGWLMSKQL